MILIADSGSTKTAWQLINDNKKAGQYHTIGLNPYFIEPPQMAAYIEQGLASHMDVNKITHVYFYGAGCSSPAKCKDVQTAIARVFKHAHIEVDHDLMAAARALCGKHEGIAAILGTGANTCYYNGKEIVKNVTALGYILGDEGSGSYMGKKLIQAFLNQEMPADLKENFLIQYHPITKEEIFEAVYKKPLPNRYLASFSLFLGQHIQHPFAHDIVLQSFNDFFDKHICKYEQHNVLKFSCVGSVGYHFNEQLRQVAAQRQVQVDKILESPIEELVQYHIEKQ